MDIYIDTPWGPMHPEIGIRRQVFLIAPKHIHFIEFLGGYFRCFENNPLIVSDPPLIRTFIEALMLSEGNRGTLDRVAKMHIHYGETAHPVDAPHLLERGPGDTLEDVEARCRAYVIEHRENPRHHPRLSFTLNPPNMLSSFGPRFREALHALEEREAQRLSYKVASVADDIVSIEVNGTVYSDAADVTALVSRLTQLHAGDVSYTRVPRRGLTVVLNVREGEQTTLYLAPYGKELPSWDPLLGQ